MVLISIAFAATAAVALAGVPGDAAVGTAVINTSSWRLVENGFMSWHFSENHAFWQSGAIVPMVGHWSLADGRLCHTFGHRWECWNQVRASKRGISAVVGGKRIMVLTPNR